MMSRNDPQPPINRWPRRLSWLLVLCAILVGLYFSRSHWLAGLADAWIVNEPLSKSDAIVVLGGGVETRPFEAAKLYNQGLAPRILVMNPKPVPANALGILPSETELTRQILIKQSVPSSAILILSNEVTSTYEESVTLRDWVKTNAIKKAIITTDLFHTRRARWIFRKELKSSAIQITVDAVPVREYTAQDWWHSEHGVVAFQNEVLKFGYYWIKY